MRNHGTRLDSLERRGPMTEARPMTDEERQAEEEWQTEALIGTLSNPFLAIGPNVSPSERVHAERLLAEERAHIAEILTLLGLGEERSRQAGESADDRPMAFTDEGGGI